ncbi:MAG: hypothetical protein JWO93_1021 [Micrococcaceae bacterium]|nr:hypothetical protein [Micrococcaceae bacterium]
MVQVTCPGCGGRFDADPDAAPSSLSAAAECSNTCAWVTGYGLSTPGLARFHQMIVDTYGAQHPAPPTPRIRVAYSLVGLHLALDRGISGPGVRAAHGLMGKPTPDWPAFAPPSGHAALTIADVAAEGWQADSAGGHASVVMRWATMVWATWRPSQSAVESLVAHLFTGTEGFWADKDNYRR